MRKIKLGNANHIKLVFSSLIIFFLFFVSYTLSNYLYFDPSSIKFETSSIKIFDENNVLLWEVSKDNSVRNTPVKISQVPNYCQQALIAIEDRTFKSNIGIDVNGLGRLGLSFISKGSLGGGSTISQQVIKNYFNNIYNRNAVDKYKEMIYAVKLNSYYTKDQILEMYLNNVYFGDLNYGIGAAAENYFNKKVEDLSLSECAYLAGIPQWPGVYSPNGNVEMGKKRQAQVLQAMLEQGTISYQESINAYIQDLKFDLKEIEVRAPHFIQYLQDLFEHQPNSNLNSNSLKTSYDYKLHQDILKILQNNISKWNVDKLNNGAVVVFHQNELKVMIGSRDFFNDEINGKFNSALGLRQPGSALTPLFNVFKNESKINLISPNAETDLYKSFEVSLTGYKDSAEEFKCNEKLLTEGCEFSIFDLSKIYHIKLNGYPVSEIPQTQINFSDINLELVKEFNNQSVEYKSFKVLLGETSNHKDSVAIATDGEYTIGVWTGNTKGEEIVGLFSDYPLTISKNIIDYLK